MAIINGTIADNKLTGTSGNDTLNGLAGDDTLIGGAGADVLYGDDGDDVLNGGTGADTMYGGIWSDQYYVDNVGDVIVEDPTNWGWGDTVYTTLSTYTLGALLEELEYIGTGNFTGTILKDTGAQITSKGGNDSLTGGAGGDAFWSNGGNDTLIGGGGGDFLNGGTGADRMEGGAGNDNYVVDNLNDVVIENPDSGRDGISASLYTYTLGAHIEDLEYGGDQYHAFTGIGNDLSGYLQSSEGDGGDLLMALGGNDYVWGYAGNDTLDGGSGADTMEGGQGDDTYVVDNSADVVYEYSVSWGIDTVLTDLPTYTLGTNVENLIYTGTGSFTGTGNGLDNYIKGGASDDTLSGLAGNDILEPGDGDALIDGGEGRDIVLLAGLLADYTIQPNNPEPGKVRVTHTATSDGMTLANVEILMFADGNIVDLNNVYGLTASTGDDVLEGAASADTINGLDGKDLVFGNDGNDKLYGGAGNDTLVGGSGSDTMQGGAGDDTYYVNTTTDRIYETTVIGGTVDARGTDKVISRASWTLGSYVENLVLEGAGAINGTGNSAANTITGNDAANTLNGGGGNDTLIGGGGNDRLIGGSGTDVLQGGLGDDTYVMADKLDQIMEGPGQGMDVIETAISFSLVGYDWVEDLKLTGTAAISGTGNARNNTLIGSSNSAANKLYGGTGDDTYVVGVGDIVVEKAGEGDYDEVESSISWTLSANIESLELTGTKPVNGTGNGDNNLIIGNSGNNKLDGKGGLDTMYGGLGNDTYYVDDSSDGAYESGNEGTDIVYAGTTYTLSAEVENLTLTGTAAIDGTGNGAANVIIGNGVANTLDGAGGDDVLKGGAGNDTLYGGIGNDMLDGGTGLDSFEGGAGDDTYILDQESELANVAENIGEGSDTLKTGYSNISSTAKLVDISAANVVNGKLVYFENITLGGTGKFNLTGNEADNTLTGNTSVNVMTGGDGNDTYVVSAGDIVVEGNGMGGGIDTIKTSISYSLVDTDGTGSNGGSVENLILTGTLAVNGTGNDLDNDLTGNGAANILKGNGGNDKLYGLAGADSLYGGLGDDTIYGGAGNDRLDGGEGSDTFVFNTAPNSTSNVDAIANFVSGTDMIKLDAAIFTRLLVDGMTFESGLTVSSTSDKDIKYETDTGYLYYDSNGTTSGGLVKFATLTGHPTLAEADIVLLDA